MASDILAHQFRSVGALPLVIPFSEVYVSLQHGIAQCQENPVVSIAKMRIHEVQNEMYLSNHSYLSYAFILSERWFNELTVEQQKVLNIAEKRARKQQRLLSAQLEGEYLQEIISYGNTTLYSGEYTLGMKTVMQQLPTTAALQPVLDTIRGEYHD
jgi:C4-dicarboxylate-binding protein DctP